MQKSGTSFLPEGTVISQSFLRQQSSFGSNHDESDIKWRPQSPRKAPEDNLPVGSETMSADPGTTAPKSSGLGSSFGPDAYPQDSEQVHLEDTQVLHAPSTGSHDLDTHRHKTNNQTAPDQESERRTLDPSVHDPRNISSNTISSSLPMPQSKPQTEVQNTRKGQHSHRTSPNGPAWSQPPTADERQEGRPREKQTVDARREVMRKSLCF